jgi:hypothetical protein
MAPTSDWHEAYLEDVQRQVPRTGGEGGRRRRKPNRQRPGLHTDIQRPGDEVQAVRTETRTELLRVRITAAWSQALCVYAEQAGCTMSDVVMDALELLFAQARRSNAVL